MEGKPIWKSKILWIFIFILAAMTIPKYQELRESARDAYITQSLELDYNIITRVDVSYAGTARMVYRVVVDVSEIPPEIQLKLVAEKYGEKEIGLGMNLLYSFTSQICQPTKQLTL